MKNGSELLKEITVYFILFGILYLFYASLWTLAAMPFVIFFYRKLRKQELEQKRRETLGFQFKDALISLAASLRAGYSVENALKESLGEMSLMYGKNAMITKEIQIMVNQIALGIPAEQVFSDFAERSRVPDIETFSQVFSIAKRSDGDLVGIVLKTSDEISAKADIKNEISVLVSSKRLEQNIMSLMPAAIILYINVSSKGLLEPLYGNMTGICIMTACLLLYAFAYLLGRRLLKIEV